MSETSTDVASQVDFLPFRLPLYPEEGAVVARVITARFVETVRPKATRTEYPDAGCPGLYLIVQPSGTRTWAFRFVHSGKSGKKTLGAAGDGGLSLAAARATAATWRRRFEQGVAPDVTGVTV